MNEIQDERVKSETELWEVHIEVKVNVGKQKKICWYFNRGYVGIVSWDQTVCLNTHKRIVNRTLLEMIVVSEIATKCTEKCVRRDALGEKIVNNYMKMLRKQTQSYETNFGEV